MATKKYLSLERLEEYDALIKEKIDAGLATKANSSHNHDSAYDSKGSANTALASAKSYTDTEVAKKANASHSHSAATTEANGFMSSTDKAKLDGIASGANKTTVDSSLSSTSTNPVQNKVVNSALSGKVPTSRTVNGKALSGNITLSASDVGADASGSANTALTNAKAYTDEQINLIVGEGAAETLDTIGEISAALKNNADIIDTLASKTSLDSHTSNATVHITSAERTKWNAAKTHADSAHAPSNAEKNQNAFSNIVVGETTISADSATDSLTLVGSNVTITPDATNDKVTIGITKSNVTSALGYTPPTSNTWRGIQDNLTSTSTTDSLSANQGKVLKDLVDGKASSSHSHSAMTGATSSAAGKAGFVPAPAAGNQSKFLKGDGTWATPTNTTYSAGTGISLSGTTFSNSGVRSIATGSTNGTISVNTNGTSAEVAVKGLGSAAYKATSAFDAAGAANTALESAKTYTDEVASGKSDTGHTHNYAGSSSAGGAATSANKLNTNAGSATQPVYFANGVPVATTYTLGKSVPSDAKFTDTTYSNASTTADGLMSLEDKTKLNYTNLAYGTCGTAAATAAKVISVSGNTQWALTAGSRITVKFSYTNTASNPTFNVNGTGAKAVWYNTGVITTSNLSYAGYANRPMDFVYDGTQFVFTGWSIDNNTTYTLSSFGVTATKDELNKLDGVTATATELNYVDGVTSNIQTQLDSKAASSHSHSDATTSAAGFMTAAMVTKLNGIATGANKITVDSALSSSSTNPVQNKIVNSAISTLTSSVSANTSSINSHTSSISALQTAVSEIQEITSEEIQSLFQQ